MKLISKHNSCDIFSFLDYAIKYQDVDVEVVEVFSVSLNTPTYTLIDSFMSLVLIWLLIIWLVIRY
tara:strand:- start:151 stop:348 length:198 start_codon:yes stop_codon:yes gene_type:complete